MTEHVLSALAKRRAELAGEAVQLRSQLAVIATDMGHLDAVIRQFDPDHSIAAIRPKRPRGPDVAGRGERSRVLLAVLREAGEPLATAEIVRRMMVRAGQDGEDRRLVRMLMKRISMALARQAQRGAVRSEHGPVVS